MRRHWFVLLSGLLFALVNALENLAYYQLGATGALGRPRDWALLPRRTLGAMLGITLGFMALEYGAMALLDPADRGG